MVVPTLWVPNGNRFTRTHGNLQPQIVMLLGGEGWHGS